MKLALLALLLAGCSHGDRWNESPEDMAVRRAIERINSPKDESAADGGPSTSEPKGEPK